MVKLLSEENIISQINENNKQYISILQSISNVKKIKIPNIYTEIASFYNKILFDKNDIIFGYFENKFHFIIEKTPNFIYIYSNNKDIKINNLDYKFLLNLEFKRKKRLSLFYEEATFHESIYKKSFFLGNEIFINLTDKKVIKKIYKVKENQITINNVITSEIAFNIKNFNIKNIFSEQINYIPIYLKFLKYIKEKDPIIEKYKDNTIKYNELGIFIKEEFRKNYKNDINEQITYIIDLIKNL